MLRSMTGFGAAGSEGGSLSLRVEIRAVNHRHLQVRSRLGSDFVALEAEVERLVRKRLQRGSVTLHLAATRPRGAAARALDVETAERYRDELMALSARLGLPEKPSLQTLLALPGVVAAGDGGELSQADEKRILKLVDEALSHLIEMREVEGRAIEADLTKQSAALAKIVERIEKRMPGVLTAHRKALAKRVDELMGKHELAPADLAREIALLSDRLDVSEEVDRLRSHLAQLSSLLAKGGAIGRKLDFLVQEVFRELNTIGSKCSDAKVAHQVVDAKALAERLREQVQNVE